MKTTEQIVLTSMDSAAEVFCVEPAEMHLKNSRQEHISNAINSAFATCLLYMSTTELAKTLCAINWYKTISSARKNLHYRFGIHNALKKRNKAYEKRIIQVADLLEEKVFKKNDLLLTIEEYTHDTQFQH